MTTLGASLLLLFLADINKLKLKGIMSWLTILTISCSFYAFFIILLFYEGTYFSSFFPDIDSYLSIITVIMLGYFSIILQALSYILKGLNIASSVKPKTVLSTAGVVLLIAVFLHQQGVLNTSICVMFACILELLLVSLFFGYKILKRSHENHL